MWRLVFVCLFSWAGGHSGRAPRQDHHGRGWDIRLAVPGKPGNDYPTLGNIPRTTFSCAGRKPGYYADQETNCQAFRVCTAGSTYGFQSFLCPNGTLFNQAVFVCDWWMNVKCEASQKFFNNNEKFGNLKLGPQLMKDIKKMITHPMRNPIDKGIMKGNLVVMQDYKPPSGQLFPNSALIASVDRTPSNVFVPPKITQQNFGQTNFIRDTSFAGSTPSPSYIPFDVQLTQADAEVFQRQRQNGQQWQSGQQFQNGQHWQNGQQLQNSQQWQNGQQLQNSQQLQSSQQWQNGQQLQNSQQLQNNQQWQNGQQWQNNRQNSQSGNPFGRLVQPTTSTNNNANTIRQNQLSQTQLNPAPTTYNPQNFNNQRIQGNRQNAQYTANKTPVQWNSGKQAEFGVSLTKQQFNHNSNQASQQQNLGFPKFSSDVKGRVGNEAKENLVSNNDIPSTVITKTITVNRIIQEPKTGQPKSRVVFKTWIVKPSKAAKLVAEPTAYTYSRPTPPISERQVEASTPYVYDRPTTPPPPPPSPAKIVSEPDESYVYNKPTVAAKIVSEQDEPYVYNTPTVAAKVRSTVRQLPRVTEAEEPYVYNKPTAAVKIVSTVRQVPRAYLPPTTPAPTVARLYQPPTTVEPTKPSRLYLTPTTFNPLERIYLPPSQPAPFRQYLTPNPDIQTPFSQNEKLIAAPTSPSPVYVAPTKEIFTQPSFTLTKHSRINTNHNNLTFSDILTKEKLDITVNDIVKDTSKILKSASNEQFGRLTQDLNSVDYPEESAYLPPDSNPSSKESLTPSTLPDTAKSSRLTQAPLKDLEPPLETPNDVQNTNQLSNLPFFKQPTNTIERTVSLKISIPENVASYLFKNTNDSDLDRLEILNTGSSNYLVLTNQLATSTTPTFIPIGKLIADKNSSLSNSQALVFSLLANSINAAKAYGNIAQQNALSATPTQPQFQNVNEEELARITNQISQLTSSQYSGNNQNGNLGNAKIVSTSQTTTSNSGTQQAPTQFTNNLVQNSGQSGQLNVAPQQSGSFYSSQFQFGNGFRPVVSNDNQNQVYSGQLYQLPVPQVTEQIYNKGSPAKLVQADNVNNFATEAEHLYTNQHSNAQNNINQSKQSSAEVEIVQSHSLPVPSPAKLQVAPDEANFNSQESSQAFINNFLNSEGISAQVQDNIIGTIPHPLEKNKLVTYKKDQSYSFYTRLDGNGLDQPTPSGRNPQLNAGSQQNAKLIQANDDIYQLIPSVGYQLEDEKEQEKILNAFNINEFGSPKSENNNNNEGYILPTPANRRSDVLTTNVDFSVTHPFAKQLLVQRKPNAIYDGPSSYSAPQGSIGFLDTRQQILQNQNLNARLEQFDINSNGNGYPPNSQRQFGY
ncbi:uncharacterized protein LOC134749764 isoform X1 [Cydia strobilella]|uniref:uncharacterized protein LOC134749764 isoform X1 n=1 Tax=Cydia strobilella TaxID=1100964 RepID=UPI003003A8DB